MNKPDKFQIMGVSGAIAGNTGNGKARNTPDSKVQELLKVLDKRRAEIERHNN